MQVEELLQATVTALEDIKAENIVTLDVRGMTSIADYMVICSARSSRHLRAIADDVLTKLKGQFSIPITINGENSSGWILLDLGDIIVHIMSEETRDFYALEKRLQKT